MKDQTHFSLTAVTPANAAQLINSRLWLQNPANKPLMTATDVSAFLGQRKLYKAFPPFQGQVPEQPRKWEIYNCSYFQMRREMLVQRIYRAKFCSSCTGVIPIDFNGGLTYIKVMGKTNFQSQPHPQISKYICPKVTSETGEI